MLIAIIIYINLPKFSNVMEIKKKAIMHGITASMIMFAIYFSILSISNSFSHAAAQFFGLWYWILLLVIGFGVQIGLYSYIKNMHHISKTVKAGVAATGTMSTGSMIACCAHHLTDVLPIIGLSAAALFLVKYQLLLIAVGVSSNFIGITIMFGIMQNSKLHKENSRLFSINMKDLRNIAIVLGLIVIVILLFKSI